MMVSTHNIRRVPGNSSFQKFVVAWISSNHMDWSSRHNEFSLLE